MTEIYVRIYSNIIFYLVVMKTEHTIQMHQNTMMTDLFLFSQPPQ